MKYCLSKYSLKIKEISNDVYIYNTFSGCLVKLDKSLYKNLKSPKEETEINHFPELYSQGIIVSELTDEYLKMRGIAKNIQETDNIDCLCYVIAPTLNCNYDCKYCFENKKYRNQHMTYETAYSVFKFITNEATMHTGVKKIKITWFGGEPLLSYNLILNFSKNLISELRKKNIELESNMITNGYLLSKEKAFQLSNEANLKHVQITLDGFEETYSMNKQTSKQSFHKVLQNIINSCENLKITIRLNTDKSNFEEMKSLSKYILNDCNLKNKVSIYLAEIKNYNHIVGNDCYNAGEFINIRNDFNKFLFNNNLSTNFKMINPPHFEPNFCGIIKKYNYAIGPNGELYKCEHHFGNKNKIIGDVNLGLYYNSAYSIFLAGNLDNECHNCNLSPCCRSDCSAMYECHKQNGKCLIYDDLLKNLKNYINKFIINKNV